MGAACVLDYNSRPSAVPDHESKVEESPMVLNVEEVLSEARDLSQQGDEEGARQRLQALLRQEPDNQAALLMLGGSYFCSAMLQEAEIVFERLVLADGGKGQYSIALFNTLWKLGRTEEALEEIRRFLSLADKAKERETIAQYMALVERIEGPAAPSAD